ncbi:MAG: DMT family transporter [Beijerinckiaceae bacterium]|nr:DMT family transporter [Beijerinckiaceae bacterium]
MSPHEWGMLLVLSILWGGSFYFIGIAVKGLPPFTIVFLRVAMAALILQLALPLAGLRFPLSRPVLVAFLGMGLLNNVIPFCLIVYGQKTIASGLASILNATTPLFAVLLTHLLTREEKVTRNKLIGVMLGFCGVVVMIGGSALTGLGDNVLAQLAVLAAAFVYGLAGVFGRRFKALDVPPLATAAGQVSASSLILLPIMLIVDRPWTLAAPGLDVWLAMLGLGVISTAAAYVLFFRILATAGATNLLLVTFLIPITAIILGTLRLGESLEGKHYLGMALIGAGLAAIDGRILQCLRRRPIGADPDAGV